MAHPEQYEYCLEVRRKFPQFFTEKKVLDVGSLDVNGNNRSLFHNCDYTGIDVGPGKNVDTVSLGHQHDVPEQTYDTIISTECFEHDLYFPQTFAHIVRLLKNRGLFLFTAGGEGRHEHGTLRSDGGVDSPLTSKIPCWENYYRNVDERWIRSFFDIEANFSKFEFCYLETTRDIRFWGIKISATLPHQSSQSPTSPGKVVEESC